MCFFRNSCSLSLCTHQHQHKARMTTDVATDFLDRTLLTSKTSSECFNVVASTESGNEEHTEGGEIKVMRC